jgi:Flp pilus assembly pilin Flp
MCNGGRYTCHSQQQLSESCERHDRGGTEYAIGSRRYSHKYRGKVLLPRQWLLAFLRRPSFHYHAYQLHVWRTAGRLYFRDCVVHFHPPILGRFRGQPFAHAHYARRIDAAGVSMRTRYLRDENGASAAEFALVLIPFVGLVLAIIGLSMLLYANQTLQYATEKAARYYSVQTANNSGTPPPTASVQTYAQNAYTGPNITPSFTAATAACGYRVTGTATFPLSTGLVNISVPLSASSCFP